jgi:hypothetical protein
MFSGLLEDTGKGQQHFTSGKSTKDWGDGFEFVPPTTVPDWRLVHSISVPALVLLYLLCANTRVRTCHEEMHQYETKERASWSIATSHAKCSELTSPSSGPSHPTRIVALHRACRYKGGPGLYCSARIL